MGAKGSEGGGGEINLLNRPEGKNLAAKVQTITNSNLLGYIEERARV